MLRCCTHLESPPPPLREQKHPALKPRDKQGKMVSTASPGVVAAQTLEFWKSTPKQSACAPFITLGPRQQGCKSSTNCSTAVPPRPQAAQATTEQGDAALVGGHD